MRVPAILLLVASVSSRALPGQGLVSQAPPGRVELASEERYLHRPIAYDNGTTRPTNAGRWSIVMRYRVSRLIGVDVSGLAWHPGNSARFPGRDYLYLTWGAGTTVSALRRRRQSVVLGLHYFMIEDIDQSPTRFDKRAWEWRVDAAWHRWMPLLGQRFDAWAGPAWVSEREQQFPPGTAPVLGASRRNFGAVLGAALLVRRRVSLSGQMTWSEWLQVQGSAGIIF